MIPRTAADITPQWLERVLSAHADFEGVRIASLEVEEIGAGVGYVGQTARLRLSAEGQNGKGGLVPQSLIVKMPFPDDQSKNRFQQQFYREVRFYSELAPDVRLRTPRCYWAAFDDASLDAIIILEDLGDLRGFRGIQDPFTCSHATAALCALADLHGQFWQSEQLGTMDWVLKPQPPEEDGPERFRHTVAQLVAEDDGLLRPSDAKLADHIATRLAGIRERLLLAPRTLVHGDWKSPNLFLGPGSDDVAAVDWQMIGHGYAVYDIAYLMTMCLATDERRRCEDDVIECYSTALEGTVGSGYRLDALRDDYRRAQLEVIVFALDVATTFDFSVNDSARSERSVLIDRAITAARDAVESGRIQ